MRKGKRNTSQGLLVPYSVHIRLEAAEKMSSYAALDPMQPFGAWSSCRTDTGAVTYSKPL